MKKSKKKVITNFVHRVVRSLKLEEPIYLLSKRMSFFRKFIPTPDLYANSDRVITRRSNLLFEINRSDYMQWFIYSGQRDSAVQLAVREINSSNPVILDIGSNFGAFSLMLAYTFENNNSKVYAFDPNPEVIRAFNRNLDMNPSLKSVIHPIQLGLSNKIGTMSFSVPQSNSGAGHLSSGEISDYEVTVKVLDHWVIEQNVGDISFVKIDVEGWEMNVLQGAEKTILSKRVPFYCEVTDEWLKRQGYSKDSMISYIKDFGYDVYVDEHNTLSKWSSNKNYPHQFDILCK